MQAQQRQNIQRLQVFERMGVLMSSCSSCCSFVCKLVEALIDLLQGQIHLTPSFT